MKTDQTFQSKVEINRMDLKNDPTSKTYIRLKVKGWKKTYYRRNNKK